jgi:hypothetical protein
MRGIGRGAGLGISCVHPSLNGVARGPLTSITVIEDTVVNG